MRKYTTIVVLILFLYMTFAMYIQTELLNYQKNTYGLSPFIFLLGFIYVPGGIILGFLRLFGELQKKGKWSFNLYYCLLLGLPSLYFLFYEIIHYKTFAGLPTSFATLILMTKPYPIFGVILGYGVVTSFYKSKE